MVRVLIEGCVHDCERSWVGACGSAVAASWLTIAKPLFRRFTSLDCCRSAGYASAVRAVKLGVVSWLTDLGVGIAEVAIAVEQAGLESLFLTEHTHVPASRRDLLEDAVQRHNPRLLDPFTALGAAAALTSRLRLGTGICILPQRDPIIVAKQVATIDYLSEGRFLFGVVAGWLVEEMRNHGVQPRLRWDLMSEQILAMKEIWTQEEAQYHGQFVNFDPIWLWPKPVRVPHPPVLVGGTGPAIPARGGRLRERVDAGGLGRPGV
jgi:probable F420-dependent oxidoreductase